MGLKLLIGTQNRAKQQELKQILSKLALQNKTKLQIVFPADLGLIEEPEETGQTIEENSLIKARYYFEKSGLPVLTDDGAFEIDALGKAPGAQAKYWAGPTLDDQKIIEKTIYELQKYPDKKNRTARLTICLTYYDGNNTIQSHGSIEGYIAGKPSKKLIKGFPYRALLIVSGKEKYYDELTAEEHARFNHRERALRDLFGKILNTISHSGKH